LGTRPKCSVGSERSQKINPKYRPCNFEKQRTQFFSEKLASEKQARTNMMDLCDIEKKAVRATSLEAFPINLEDLRRNVYLLLSEFGKHGFFDEYTVHDFSHCYEMLKLIEWLVPTETAAGMSDGDWLTTVLACYLHDLGLLITRDEFANREKSDFPRFCQQVLFSGPGAVDYRAKVQQLPGDQSERFLYQEFVRANHASRIRAWIEGKPLFSLGFAESAFAEIQNLLNKFSPAYRKDLALVCESHNLDDVNDVNDLKKYRVSQPYGNSDRETVNLQYCSVLLRSADRGGPGCLNSFSASLS
jgi:hypothetical protein